MSVYVGTSHSCTTCRAFHLQLPPHTVCGHPGFVSTVLRKHSYHQIRLPEQQLLHMYVPGRPPPPPPPPPPPHISKVTL